MTDTPLLPPLPRVPARFPPCVHPTVLAVMREWAGRQYDTEQLSDEVCRRLSLARRGVQQPPTGGE